MSNIPITKGGAAVKSYTKKTSEKFEMENI